MHRRWCGHGSLRVARHCSDRPIQGRTADRQDGSAGPGRKPDGAGHRHVLEGEELHACRTQDRFHQRRYRRQPRGSQRQGAGAHRARPGRHHFRAAGGRRTARHHRLSPRKADAIDQSRGRRRRHATPREPLRGASLCELVPMRPRAWRLRGKGPEIQDRGNPRFRFCVRIRAGRRLPARVRKRGWSGRQ
jgi:hypothetical protein